MKICLVLEGSYPYAKGGVSNWVNGIIRQMPEHEFVLWTIADLEKRRSQYLYELPSNVVEIDENFLETAMKLRTRREANPRYSRAEKAAVAELIRCGSPDWGILLDMLHVHNKNPVEFFMSEDFLEILKDFAREEFPFVGFSDLFWTIRSMFLPLFYLLGKPFPQADLYHSVSTGYAGVLAAVASIKYNKPYLLSEHGIYTREREEEILRSDWVPAAFKELWISMFYMYSRLSYQVAHRVTSLFGRASLMQQELGCPADKCQVISNGIVSKLFSAVPPKSADGRVDIGAIVRIAPIKDIKTLIYTFSLLKQEMPNTHLHILGGIDDEDYYKECQDLVAFLGVEDVEFKGVVDIIQYMQKLDFTVLTSISEGQPFAIIESMAAGRPVVATNVGCCRELIEGEDGDELGDAGICVAPMHQSALLKAMLEMCRNTGQRKAMGEIGQKRVLAYYEHDKMVENYQKAYEKVITLWQELDSN